MSGLDEADKLWKSGSALSCVEGKLAQLTSGCCVSAHVLLSRGRSMLAGAPFLKVRNSARIRKSSTLTCVGFFFFGSADGEGIALWSWNSGLNLRRFGPVFH